MRSKVRWSVLAVAVFLASAGTQLRAAAPDATRITVAKMHCNHCARQMADQLYKVPGVAKVETNLEAKMMFVIPKPAVVVSPRALWEAIEKAAKVPVKLEGPSGTFAAKPQV